MTMCSLYLCHSIIDVVTRMSEPPILSLEGTAFCGTHLIRLYSKIYDIIWLMKDSFMLDFLMHILIWHIGTKSPIFSRHWDAIDRSLMWHLGYRLYVIFGFSSIFKRTTHIWNNANIWIDIEKSNWLFEKMCQNSGSVIHLAFTQSVPHLLNDPSFECFAKLNIGSGCVSFKKISHPALVRYQAFALKRSQNSIYIVCK